MPEEVRKYQVQADFMISQKRYGDAIRIYTEGLKSAPWWPDGRFNRALLFAETKRYRDAILDMNRFLMLEPESPDARSARDRIYQWEAAMKMRVR
jgi:tetratricopeptide (TPR) repeat protein